VTQGQLLWQPPAEWVKAANITAFADWLGRTRGLTFADYQAMRRWSVDKLDDFWAAIWEYYEVRASVPYECVLAKREMPGAVWFPGARLNYAEHIFRRRRSDAPALLYSGENRELVELG
jgi:acetoacetyl-CoA synthetase